MSQKTFLQEFEEEIVSAFDPNSPSGFYYLNMGSLSFGGLENLYNRILGGIGSDVTTQNLISKVLAHQTYQMDIESRVAQMESKLANTDNPRQQML